MGRKSKLTDKQWAEVDKRLLSGEPPASIAPDYKVTPTAIRQRKLSTTDNIKNVANQIVATEQALAALPIASQITAQTFAAKLRAMSDNMLDGACLGAATFHRLASVANQEVQKIDDADPEGSMDSIKLVAALTKVANEAMAPAVALINANKEEAKRANSPQDEDHPLLTDSQREMLRGHFNAAV